MVGMCIVHIAAYIPPVPFTALALVSRLCGVTRRRYERRRERARVRHARMPCMQEGAEVRIWNRTGPGVEQRRASDERTHFVTP